MTIEIGLLIALVSTAGALTFGMIAVSRNKKIDTKSDTRCISEMMTKLDTIEGAIKEIKADMKELAKENAEIGKKLAKIEEAGKQTEQRLLRLESSKGAI